MSGSKVDADFLIGEGEAILIAEDEEDEGDGEILRGRTTAGETFCADDEVFEID